MILQPSSPAAKKKKKSRENAELIVSWPVHIHLFTVKESDAMRLFPHDKIRIQEPASSPPLLLNHLLTTLHTHTRIECCVVKHTDIEENKRQEQNIRNAIRMRNRNSRPCTAFPASRAREQRCAVQERTEQGPVCRRTSTRLAQQLPIRIRSPHPARKQRAIKKKTKAKQHKPQLAQGSRTGQN